jgi:hypothetical protein
MATGDIKIGIDIVSNTKEETKDAIKLKQAYEGAASAAGKMAGTAGSRAVAAKAAPASSGGLTGQQYGTAQGTTGMGSSARDFAKEAQGLGGLVRVYATFAANLFAVSAAFTALRDAASTENIVKGLDQLGAASGRSLGNLSKQLVAASDGAISLRDSMTAVAQASSGGLSNKQILQLGEVAKKTSEALGLSMPDAISRLSRGITKIEPELLDELGIFVKVNEASSAYALSIGKSAASLSDFEKRQAFANAVLDQGIQKFADIKIDANPYDKLLASMNNVATTGLQLVNKVLGPIASVLAESPGALAGVFGLIAMTLLKQAIPALSQWRGELAKSAETAAESAKRSYESYRDYSITKALEKEAAIVGPLQKQVNDKIVSARDDLAKVLSSKSKILARAGASEVDPEAMQKSLATEEKRRQTALASLEAQKQADIAQGTATAAKLAAYDTMAQKQHEEIIGIQSASKAYKDAAETRQKIANAEIQSEQPSPAEKLRKISADRAQAVATSKGILSRVGADSELKGMGNAFKYLFDNIKNGVPAIDDFGNVLKDQDGKIIRATQGLTGFRAATTAVSGSFLAVGDAIGKTLSAISPYLQLIGLLITAYELFDSYASKAAKEQTEFNTKISEGESAVKTVTNTFDLYVRKTKDAFTIQGIVAFTTALAGVSDSLDSQLLAYDKYKQVAGTFDKLKDSMAGFFFFTESNLEKLQKSTVESLQAVVKSLELSGKGNTQKGILAEALFGKDASIDKLYGSTKELNKAFDGLTDAEREEKAKRIAAAIDRVTKSEQYSTQAALAFHESLNSIDKTVDQIIQANAFTDLQGKLGVELVLASERFAQSLIDPLKALTAIADLAKDPKALAALGNVDLTDLYKAVTLQKQINDADKTRAEALDQQKKSKKGEGTGTQALTGGSNFLFSMIPGASEALDASIKADITKADIAVKETTNNFEKLKKLGADFSLQQIGIISKLAEAGFEKIELGLKKAKEQAALSIARTEIGISASGGADTADRTYQVRLTELKIQETLIESNYKVQIASIENAQKLDELNTTLQIATAAEMKKSSETDVKNAGETMYNLATQRMQSIVVANALKAGGQQAQDVLRMRSIPQEVMGAARARNNETVIARKQADAQLAGVRGQRVEAGLTHEAQLRDEALRREKESLDLDNKRLNTQMDYLNLATQIAGYESASVANAKLEIQNKLRANDTAAQLAEIEKNRKDSLIGASLTEQEVINKRAKNKSESIKDNATNKGIIDTISAAEKASLGTQTEMSKVSAKELETLRLKNSVEDARLSNLQAELGFKQQLGLIDEKSANAQKARYESQALQQKLAEEEKKIKDDVLQKQKAFDDAKSRTESGANLNNPQLKESLTSKQKDAQTALDLAKEQQTAFDQRKKAQQDGIDQAKAYNDLLIEQKQNQDNLNASTKSLATILGDVGQSLGDTISEFSNLAINNKKRAAQEKEAANNQKDLARIRDQNAKDELSDISSVAGATKKLFDEKTNSYRILGTVEKLAAAQRLALEANTALQSIGINIPAIFASFMRDLGPFGPPAAAAAIAAFVGSAFAGGGGGEPTFDYGTYKKDKGNYIDSSTPQNTGIKDSLDALVNISKPELPLTSKMARHLENIDGKIQTFVNYQLNNIGNATSGFTPSSTSSGTSAILGAGLGAAVGAGAGMALSGLAGLGASLLSTTAFMGTFGTTVASAGLAMMDAVNVIGDLLVPGLGTVAGAVIGLTPGFQKFATDLLVGSTDVYQSLQGMGLQIEKQTLAMAGSNLAIENYADILTTTVNHVSGFSRAFGGKDSDSTALNTKLGPVDAQAKAALEDMFSTITDTIKIGAKALDVPMRDLIVPFKKLELVSGDTKGNLEKVNTYFAEVTDDFVTQIIPDIQKYTKGTEKATQTYFRLASSQEEAKYYTDRLNISTVHYSQVVNKHGDMTAEILRQSIASAETAGSGIKDIIDGYSGSAKDMFVLYTSLKDVQQSMTTFGFSADTVNADLLRGAGGIDALSASWSSFENNFLTQSEKRLGQQTKMDTEFAKLGLETPKTAEAFKALVVGLEAGGAASSEQLGRVLALTDGMVSLVGALNATTNAVKDQEIKIYELLGESSKALTLTREKELDAMDELLRPRQIYINALTDEIAARDKLKAAYTASNTALTNSIKTLNDYKTALQGGANSTLTPAEKYAQAKSIFMQTAAAAQAAITANSSAADIAARDAALAKIQATGDALLSASREVNASGAQYAADFASVSSSIDKTSGILSTQQTDQQKQLGFLETTAESTKTMAELLDAYLKAQATTTAAQIGAQNSGSGAAQLKIPGHAMGGIASGISIVGERGPELVDFATPGRVYSNQASNDLFNTKELVAEIKALRDEVAQLREDQNKQTGDLIQTTIQSNAQNAQAIATANQNLVNQQDWKTRSQVRVA